MEDLLGIIVFVVFLVGSVIAKAAKAQQNRQGEGEQPKAPRWPGPVMTPPGFPRPAQPAPPPRPAPAPMSGEGVGTEGVGTEGLSSLEGPTAQESVSYAMDRFQRESVAMEGRHLARFRTDLDVAEEAAPEAGEGLGPDLDLGRDRLAQAVVWSEILGKPKALRARR